MTTTDDRLGALVRESCTAHEVLATQTAANRVTERVLGDGTRRTHRRGMLVAVATATAMALGVGAVAISGRLTDVPSHSVWDHNLAVTRAHVTRVAESFPTPPKARERGAAKTTAGAVAEQPQRMHPARASREFVTTASAAEALEWAKSHLPAGLRASSWNDSHASYFASDDTNEHGNSEIQVDVERQGSGAVLTVAVVAYPRPDRNPELTLDPVEVTDATVTLTRPGGPDSRGPSVRTHQLQKNETSELIAALNGQRMATLGFGFMCPAILTYDWDQVSLSTPDGLITIKVETSCGGAITVTRAGRELEGGLEGATQVRALIARLVSNR